MVQLLNYSYVSICFLNHKRPRFFSNSYGGIVDQLLLNQIHCCVRNIILRTFLRSDGFEGEKSRTLKCALKHQCCRASRNLSFQYLHAAVFEEIKIVIFYTRVLE